jgi:transmembrane sensor
VEHTSNHIDELIGKHLAGETTAEEKVIVHSWISSSDENRRYFDHFKLIFENAVRVKSIPHFDTDEAWKRMRSKLGSEKDEKIVSIRPSSLNYFYRIAASILIVALVGYFTYDWMSGDTISPVEVVSDKTIATDTLPDGSGVFLNKETKLAYAFDKKSKQHKVKLKGEAYFNINHNDDKTFIVEAGEAFIKDIGTSFNVKAYPELNTIEVVVEEGEVMFYTETNTGISLRAGGKGIYHKSTKTFTVEDAEPNVTAYKTRFFIFSDSELSAVVDELNSVYDQKIVISPALKNCRLTVSFNNEELTEITSVIAETLGLTRREVNGEIVLEGTGCYGN